MPQPTVFIDGPTSPNVPDAPPIELRSSEVDEVLGQTPAWLVRWGTTVIFGVVALLFGLAWWVRYPDVVQAPLRLIATNPPRAVIARTDGRLTRLLAHDGDSVRAGAVLAYLESTANHAEVLRLMAQLPVAEMLLRQNQLNALSQLPLTNYHQLGELQTAYQAFVQSQSQLRAYLRNGFYEQKQALLQQELTHLQNLYQNLLDQQALQRRDLDLARQDYAVQQTLADQKVIAPLELKREESKQLGRQLPYEQLKASLINNQLAQNAKQKERIDLDRQIGEQRDGFLQALNTLQSAAYAWRARYVVLAPMAGYVAWLTPLHEEQPIKTGQELYYLLPPNSHPNSYVGEMAVGQYNFGKIRTGQTVLVKLPSYPFQEYGSVSARVASIVQIASDTAYRVRIEFPAGLLTSTGQQLPFRNGLTATGEIITDDTRLIEKIFYELRRLRGR
ncbi:HlyD family secretion protein [Fibrella aquatica]|uniref:HlyD family secretion protein n=1 Tax=Fibrella aquatica TaxID=3242487 RepID=UPI0035212415